jgi:hypothetical protein
MWAKGNITEVEISGTKEELQNVALGIFNLSINQSFVVKFEHDAEPFPYDFSIRNLHISKGEGPVRVKVLNSNLYISGAMVQLHALASFLHFDTDTEGHHHYEYFPGNEYIHFDSVALVIKLKI